MPGIKAQKIAGRRRVTRSMIRQAQEEARAKRPATHAPPANAIPAAAEQLQEQAPAAETVADQAPVEENTVEDTSQQENLADSDRAPQDAPTEEHAADAVTAPADRSPKPATVKPGQAFVDRAMDAPATDTSALAGQAIARGVERGYEPASSSMMGSAAGGLTKYLTGVDVQGLADNTMNLAKGAGTLALHADSGRQSRATQAREANAAAANERSTAVQAFKDTRTNPDATPEQRKAASRAAFVAAARHVGKNLRLQAADRAIGNMPVPEMPMSHTVGVKMPEHIAPGTVVTKGMRDTSTDTSNTLLQSLMPGSGRGLLNTAKLDVDQKNAYDANVAKRNSLRTFRDERNKDRKLNGGTEQATIDASKQRIKEIRADHKAEQAARPKGGFWHGVGNFFKSLNPFSSRALGDTKDYTPEVQSQLDSLKAEKNTIKSRSSWGMLGHEDSARVAEIDRQRKLLASTSLSPERQAQVDAEKRNIKDAKGLMKGGYSLEEKAQIKELTKEKKGIFKQAKKDERNVNKNLGKTVRASGYVGGLESTNEVNPELTKKTTGGRFAQGVRSFGQGLGLTGKVIGGSAEDARAEHAKGNVKTAMAIAGSGIATSTTAAALHFAAPGAGTVFGNVKSGTAASMKLAGGGLEAAGEYGAEGQDARDRQHALTSGALAQQSSEKAIDWQGAVPEKDADTMGAVKNTASNAFALASATGGVDALQKKIMDEVE